MGTPRRFVTRSFRRSAGSAFELKAMVSEATGHPCWIYEFSRNYLDPKKYKLALKIDRIKRNINCSLKV